MALSRDIDQEVSETLCTLLSFDEDNFLSQEEVEENLRNCPNIGHDSTADKIYQDYNNGNSDTNSARIDDNTNNGDEPGGHAKQEYDALQEVDEEQKQLDQILQDDDHIDTTENELKIYHSDNAIGDEDRSLESALNTLIAAAVAEDPTSILSQEATTVIKSEYVFEPEDITEENLQPPPLPAVNAVSETKPVDHAKTEDKPKPNDNLQLKLEFEPKVELQLKVEPQAVEESELKPEDEGKVHTASPNTLHEDINVKLEFTCESEQFIEEQIAHDFYIADEFQKASLDCGITQKDISSPNELFENNDYESSDLLHRSLLDQSMDHSNSSKKECIFNIDDDSHICNIMSDHNYTTQEKPTNSENLHKLLINHILRSKGSSLSMQVVTEFVDKTLANIQMFGTDNGSQIDTNEEEVHETTGMIDIFADEKSKKSAIFDVSLKVLANKEHEQTEEADKISKTEETQESSFPQDIVYKTVSVASIATLQANCSEPLEHIMETTADSIIQSEDKIVSDSSASSTEPNNLIFSNDKAEGMHPESFTTELMEKEGCDDGATIEDEICDESDVSKNEAKADSEKLSEVQGQVENMQVELVEDQKIATKMSVFNKELEQMTMNVMRDDQSDELITTEEFLGDVDTCKEKTTKSILTNKQCSKANHELDATENTTSYDVNEFKTMNILSVASPPEYCSEPLEHTSFDEAFDLNCNEKLTVINHLHSLKSFAKSLRDDCETFTSSTTTIESKLQKYMQEKLEIFKKIVRAATALRCEEKSIQTDEYFSKRKIRKMKQSRKECLLNPTGSSSSSDDDNLSSTENSIKSHLRVRRKVSTSLMSSPAKTGINYDISKKECVAADYDDGVALVEYTQSEVFETETFCNDTFSHVRKINTNDSISDNGMESDLDDTWHRKKSSNAVDSPVGRASQNESDKENATGKVFSNNKKSPQDAGDKEIERLINLNGLIKRSKLGAGKTTNERVKTKSINNKNKDIIDSFTDDDIQAEIFSDPSISESEEEITETQFLKRCNENVKQQLLSDSNSENTESDVSDDIEEILSSSEGSNSPLVDRFLKKFNVNDSDDEESEKFDNNKSSILNETSDFKSNLTDKNKSNSSENSDCEMLDDMVATTKSKHSNPKSLEKMLSVVEKRKKMNRLCDSISLSSESESSSDVEAVEEKSRIKPMLRPEQLAGVTREAQRNESERIRRLEKKHKTLAKLLKERPDVQEECNLILDYNEDSKTFIKVHPDIVKHLKQHQREGVRFMYDSCYGGIEALKKSPGSGCILAHCMGLGKTLQLIALLHTVISYKELKTSKVLVLCPKSTVMNWADEIERWLGPLKPKYYTFNDTSDVNDKIQILKDWSASTINKAGILLIGYEAFRTLVFYHSYKNRGIAQSRLDSIRNDVDKYLLSPGADLVVCDEGHIIKNSKSAISLAVTQIKTPKRIVLTGTPIQNNLKEYYSMVNFIKPLFLGTEKEFANLYANPIKNGQHKDSSKRDIQVMKQRSFVLHKKLSKFVQRKEAELLKTFLPQKYEYVLFIPMTKVQTVLYEHILAIISKKDDRGKGLITDYTCLRKIWTHPKVLEDAWINATAQKHRRDSRKPPAAVHSDDDQPDDVYDSQTGVISVTNDWWRSLLAEKDLETILPSNKLRTMFEILRMCEEKGEKCLIFSAFVAVLNVVEYFFKKMNDKDADTLNELKMSQGYQVKNTWILGKDYYRLDGKTPKLIRHEMIEQFNSLANKRARVFLISSRAGGQGINLTGANRVIILDTSWNPSNDQQNIFRVFRLGQKKNCYIYRLIAMGTMEEKVYSRSVTKQAMSFRVVDEQQIDRHYSMAELTELYSLTTPDYENRPMPDCPQDSILACLLLNYPSLVYKYHEHDSLLENKVEQELSEQEKQDAWAAYERDQQMNSEIREMPNPDELQNNLAVPKFPPYLGSSLSAFNQMSALFNYGNFSPASLSPYLPYLSHLGNYTASNQQYLEMRKRLAEGTFPYPDISTSLGTTPFNTPFGQNAPKSTNPLIPDISNLHNSALHTNPLSALGDLSMFGLGNTNNHMAHNVNTSTLQQQQQRQHSSPTYSSTTNQTTANSMQANFDYQMYENSLKSLVNYRHDFSSNGNSTNKSKAGNMPPVPVQAFKNPLYTQMSNMNYEKNAMSNINSPSPKSMEQQQTQKQHSDKNSGKSAALADNSILPLNISSNKNSFGNIGNSGSNSGARSSPLPQVATKRAYNDVNISNANEGRLTPNQKTTKDAHNTGGLKSFQSYKNSNTTANSVNINSSIYANKNLTTGKTSSNDNLKNNKSSMQIIPTSSPPGTSSVTKQYTDISPSISLTAVTTTSVSKNSSNSNFHQLKNPPKNTANNKITTSNNNSSNKSTELTKTSTSYPTNKFFEMNKKPPPNRPVSKTNTLPTKTKQSTSSDTISKSATTTTTTTQNAYQQNANEIGSKLLAAVNNARNKNIIQKKPQNLTIQQIKSVTTSTARTSATITAVKTTQNGSSTAKSTTKTSTAPLQSDTRKTGMASMEKTLESNKISTPSSSGQAQKNGSSTSPALKIQPSSANKSTTSTKANDNMLTYILETCINQKKFAIGAPTKGGGGTTVTRVQAPGKRKNPESIPKDAGSNETKRAK